MELAQATALLRAGRAGSRRDLPRGCKGRGPTQVERAHRSKMLVDSHCHIDGDQFAADIDGVVDSTGHKRKEIIGVLELLDKEGASSFSPADMEALGLFANQAAVSIEQSRTHRNPNVGAE